MVRAGRRLRPFIATLDQVVASLGSFLLITAVARTGSVEVFASFSVAYLTFQIALGLFRALFAEPYMVEVATAGVDSRKMDQLVLSASTSAALVGIGAVLLMFTLLPTSGFSSMLLLMAFPVSVGADILRYVAIARERPTVALSMDLVRTVGFFAVYLFLSHRSTVTAEAVLLIWLAIVGLTTVVSVSVLRVVPRSPSFGLWYSTSGRTAKAFGAEFVLTRSSMLAVTYGFVWFATTPEVAGFRAGSSLTNMVSVLFSSVPLVLVPRYRAVFTASSNRITSGKRLRVASKTSGFLVGLTALASIFILNLPRSLGVALLGDSWAATEPFLPGLLLWTSGAAATLGPVLVLRSTGLLRKGVMARGFQSLSVLSGGFLGAWTLGPMGATLGLAFGSWMGVAAWYFVIWEGGAWRVRGLSGEPLA